MESTIKAPSSSTPMPTTALTKSPDANSSTNSGEISPNSAIGLPTTPPGISSLVPCDIMADVFRRQGQISSKRIYEKNSLPILRETPWPIPPSSDN